MQSRGIIDAFCTNCDDLSQKAPKRIRKTKNFLALIGFSCRKYSRKATFFIWANVDFLRACECYHTDKDRIRPYFAVGDSFAGIGPSWDFGERASPIKKLRFNPILKRQPIHPSKLPRIVADQGQTVRAGNGGGHHVALADR